MKFYKNMYLGDTITDPAKIKRKLKSHAGVQVYVIALAQGADQLEIYHSAYLKQKYYRHHPPVIVGIASNYEEAVSLIMQITQECLGTMGNCNLKEYLKYRASSDYGVNI